MVAWIIGGVLLAVAASAFTLIWWWVGDMWADAEHKKFGPPRTDPIAPKPTVIKQPKPPPPKSEPRA